MKRIPVVNFHGPFDFEMCILHVIKHLLKKCTESFINMSIFILTTDWDLSFDYPSLDKIKGTGGMMKRPYHE